MTEQQFNEITKWQKETFKDATPLSKLHHLRQELKELTGEYGCGASTDPKAKPHEFADCFFLLFGAAAADGMSYQDICNAIDEKFSINKNRKWGKPDANGVVNHIKPQPQLVYCKNCGKERVGEVHCHNCSSTEFEPVIIM